jgi:hypothetical protein
MGPAGHLTWAWVRGRLDHATTPYIGSHQPGAARRAHATSSGRNPIPVNFEEPLKPEPGATWARNCDTHRLFRLPSAGLAPVYAETYGAVYGELLWRPRIELPLDPDRHGRYLDHESELEGKAIPDTLRRAFDALAALL